VEVPGESQIRIQWSLNKDRVTLHADLSIPCASVTGTGIDPIILGARPSERQAKDEALRPAAEQPAAERSRKNPTHF
jgi:hypothetical protein